MKIFAKRKRKSGSSQSTTKVRTVNKSDPVVEELLKKDPSEWNAKERRMVKRYRERKADEVINEGTGQAITDELTVSKPTQNDAGDIEEDPPVKEEIADRKERDGESSSATSDDSSSSESSSYSESEENVKKENKIKEESQSLRTQPQPIDEDENVGTEQDKIDKDHDIWKLLEKLNSKHKRTLSRKLDRLGKAGLEEVEMEANEILSDVNNVATTKLDNKETEIKVDLTKIETQKLLPKKKKRKKEVDTTTLTPEERLRREEQRRFQKEAAERRARGEDIKPGHKHPLNSQRRRANRRKPKWKKSSAGETHEHNLSGYMFRKHTGEEQPVM